MRLALPALLWHVFVLVCADDAASEATRTGPDRSDKDVEDRVAMVESVADYHLVTVPWQNRPDFDARFS